MKYRYAVTYQLFLNPNKKFKNKKNKQQLIEAAVEFMSNEEKCVNPTPLKPHPPEVIIQKQWDNYFPRFTQKGIQNLLPWRIMEHQGRHRTFYIGSSVSFESIEDVIKYNLQVLKFNGIS